jgi:hypothetical protein
LASFKIFFLNFLEEGPFTLIAFLLKLKEKIL